MSANGYDEQYYKNFKLLCGSANGLPKVDFAEILLNVSNPPPREAVEAAFERHAEGSGASRHITADCMLEVTAELQDSSNAAFITTSLVQSMEKLAFRRLFQLVDEDNSGRVDVQELKSFVDALATVIQIQNYTQQEASRWMREVGEKEIDFPTFIVVARRLIGATPIIRVVEKVEEAKRALKERKASALNLFQTRVLGSMLRKRGATVAGPPPSLSQSPSTVIAPAEVTLESSHADPAAGFDDDSDDDRRPRRRRSPAGGAAAAASGDCSSAELGVMQFLHAVKDDNDDLLRVVSPDPGAEQPALTEAARHRVTAALQSARSSRTLAALNALCVERDGVLEAPKTAAALHQQCVRVTEAIRGTSGTLFEMQRAAVDRIVREASDFLARLHQAQQAASAKVPPLRLGADGARGRAGTTATDDSSPQQQQGTRARSRTRAQTIFESSFGKDVELLEDVAQEKLEVVLECRREIAHVTEDSVYAFSQIVQPRNRIVDVAMSLLPHVRSSSALALALRSFELQTQELHDMLALFKLFSAGAKSAGSRSGSADALDEMASQSQNRGSNGNGGGGGGEPLSVVELLRYAHENHWGERPPAEMPDRAAELIDSATVLTAFVDDLFRKETPTAWLKRLGDTSAELAHQVKALHASFLRDRAVQTPTELLISLQNFPVSFKMKDAGHNPREDVDADRDNQATMREKRRLALAHARIRRTLVADVTRQAESVDLLLRRYLTAGVIVPDNFGRVVSTDPEKRGRHTFRFGTRLIDLTPTDDQKLSVHVGAGYFFFDEFCAKNTVLEMARLQREDNRAAARAADKPPGATGVSNKYGSNGDASSVRSISTVTVPTRSGSALSPQHHTMEFTVRSGSPVQVIPFPWLSEGRSASAALAEATRARSPSNNNEQKSGINWTVGAATRPRR